MDPLPLVNLTVHLLAAFVWVGGMLFMSLVLAPVGRGLSAEARRAVLSPVGRRFRTVGWICIGLLLLTGGLNLYFFRLPLEGLLLVKLSLVLCMLLLSVLHDFFLGPRMVLLLERATAPGGEALRPAMARAGMQVGLLARLNLLLGVSVVFLGMLIGRGYW